MSSRPLISLPATWLDWVIVVYLAVVASAVTMVLQTWAQARVEPFPRSGRHGHGTSLGGGIRGRPGRGER